MIRKSQLFLAIAALAGMNAAMAACNTSQWAQGAPPNPAGGTMAQGTVVGSPVAGNPIAGVSRYSGACALRSTAAGNYAVDGLPSGEVGYIARFYVHTGISSGEADIFQARSNGADTATTVGGQADDYNIVRVTYDRTANALKFYNRSGGMNSIPVTANRWYGVELKWTGGSTNTLDVEIRGSGVDQTAPQDPGAYSGYSVATGGQGIDYARFGWISGGTGGAIQVDAFESRRSSDIGFLKRGDITGEGVCDSDDVTEMVDDILNVPLNQAASIALGQPDCTEDGAVDSDDLTCLVGYVLNDDLANERCGDPQP